MKQEKETKENDNRTYVELKFTYCFKKITNNKMIIVLM